MNPPSLRPVALTALCLAAAISLRAQPAQSSPFLEKPVPIPGLIEAENFDAGPAGVAFHDLDVLADPPKGGEARQNGLRYRRHVVGIETTMTAPRFLLVGQIKQGEWLAYTVEVLRDATYDLEVSLSGWRDGDQAGQFRIEIDGTDVTGPLTAPNTKSWQKVAMLTHKGIPLKKGVHTMRVVITRGDEVLNLESFRFIDATPKPAATPKPPSTP